MPLEGIAKKSAVNLEVDRLADCVLEVFEGNLAATWLLDDLGHQSPSSVYLRALPRDFSTG